MDNQVSDRPSLPIVLAVTGASGAIYAVRLLQMLLASGRQVHVTISPSGASVVKQELGLDLKLSERGCDLVGFLRSGVEPKTTANIEILDQALAALSAGHAHFHHYQDYFTPIASGSFLTEAMVVCPCSGGTLSGIVRSNSGNLIERAAEVHLKERRPLIVVPRETPLSTFQIENMLRASQAGVVVLPAAPGWYHGVTELSDLVDFVVARILDQLRLPHQLMRRWASP
ncbi:MAG: UbiX family flavin prenyltransferase [Pirellulaceae bacterium]|nr:UbiX family flavin prenyltransferase [Pirellulaceae bacterium]